MDDGDDSILRSATISVCPVRGLSHSVPLISFRSIFVRGTVVSRLEQPDFPIHLIAHPLISLFRHFLDGNSDVIPFPNPYNPEPAFSESRAGICGLIVGFNDEVSQLQPH